MASRYILAIQYSEDHGKQVYRKYQKQRPLGELETKHKYLRAEPVFQHDSVDIDLGSTWANHTFHTKSNADLIDEHNESVHKAVIRNHTKSAPSSKPRNNFLTVNGKNNNVRPRSCPASDKKQENKQSPDKNEKRKPLYKISADYDYLEARNSYNSVSEKIKEHRSPQGSSTGSIEASTSEPSTSRLESPSQSWLTFHGNTPNSAGVVDAFTGHDNGEFFVVEGSTGSHVATKLKKGDKIRIGRNGEVLPTATSRQESHTNGCSAHELEEILREGQQKKRKNKAVPLCWQDALVEPQTKLVEPGTVPEIKRTMVVVNSSQPVTFENLNKNSTTAQNLLHRNNGYRIIHRNKVRQTGKHGAGVVKSISYEKSADRSDDRISYEEIVERAIQKGRQSAQDRISRGRGQFQAKENHDEIVTETIEVDMKHVEAVNQREALQTPSREALQTPSKLSMTESAVFSSESRPTSVLYRAENRSTCTSVLDRVIESRSGFRPHTASSVSDPDLSIIQPGTRPRPKHERIRSPTKPPSARLAHKSRMASGGPNIRSMRDGKGRMAGGGDQEFIKITQQITVPKIRKTSVAKTKEMSTSPTEAISTVSKQNQIQYNPNMLPLHLLPGVTHLRTNTPITAPNTQSLLIPTGGRAAANSVVGSSDVNSLSDFSETDFNKHADLDDDLADYEVRVHDLSHSDQGQGHEDNFLGRVDEVSDQLHGANLDGKAQQIMEVSQDTKAFLDSVKREHPASRAVSVALESVSQASDRVMTPQSVSQASDRVMTPQEELQQMRVEIKATLKKTQNETQRDIQDMFLGQYD